MTAQFTTLTEAMDAWCRDEERLAEMRQLCSQHKVPIDVSQIPRVTDAELMEFKRRIHAYREVTQETATTTGKRKDRDDDLAPAWHARSLQKNTLVSACRALGVNSGGGQSRKQLSVAFSEAVEAIPTRDLTLRLSRLSKADLKEVCVAAKVKAYGNKDALIERYAGVVHPTPIPAAFVADID